VIGAGTAGQDRCPGSSRGEVRSRATSGWTFLGLALVLAIAAPALGQSPPAPPPPPAEDPGPIPLAEIAGRADDLAALLIEVESAATPARDVQAIEARLPALRTRLQASLVDTQKRLDAGAPLALLDRLDATWQATRRQIRGWSDTVTRRATQLQQDVERLDSLRETWARSRADAVSAGAPALVLGRIDELLKAISSTKARLESRLAALLVLQHRLSQELGRCEQILARIAEVRAELFAQLTARTGLPIWNPALWTGAVTEIGPAWQESANTLDRIAERLIRSQAGRLPLLLAVFVGLVALLYQARGRIRQGSAAGTATVSAVFEHPISTGVILTTVVGMLFYTDELALYLYTAGLIGVVPVLRLMRTFVTGPVTLALYSLGTLFVVDQLRGLISTATQLDQVVYLIEMLASVLLIVWLRAAWQASRIRASTLPRAQAGTAALLVAFLMAFVAGALGYMHLARMIGTGALGSSYAGLVMAVGVRAIRDLVAYALRVRPLRLLRAVQLHRPLIEHRVAGFLGWAGTIGWVVSTLSSFAVLDRVTAIGSEILGFRIGWGAAGASVADVVAFVVAMWLAVKVARLTRFILYEDVFSRIRLAKGVPQTLASVIQYGIVIVGFSMALVALGIDFTKLTILLGALGVGVGFGLQNVVSNVASGLVLLFERTVRIGDAIHVVGEGGEVEGEVQAIGIRATTVRSWEGAEVIVPNADLVSHVVTNWTLSDRRSRLTVLVSVVPGSDPDHVSRLLTDAARAHPKVAATPVPVVLFRSLTDGVLLFELRCWTDDYDSGVVTRSELTALIYRALEAQRIEISVPPRAVRLTMEGTPPPPRPE
jgi:potassium-dependent mechanosensitive channel